MGGGAAPAKPVYQQIEEQVEGAIVCGALAPGERLPPERELAAARASAG